MIFTHILAFILTIKNRSSAFIDIPIIPIMSFIVLHLFEIISSEAFENYDYTKSPTTVLKVNTQNINGEFVIKKSKHHFKNNRFI